MVKLCDLAVEFLLILLVVFTPLVYGAVHPGALGSFEIIAAFMFLFTA